MQPLKLHQIDWPIFDAVVYGAKVDGVTDDTGAWQFAIDAAVAAGRGRVVSSKPGVSIIAGPLRDTGGANAQLLLPSIDYVDTEQISLSIEGWMPPPPIVSVIGGTPAPDNHLVLKSTLAGSAGGSVIGGYGPSGTLEGFTNVMLQLRNLTVRCVPDPVLSGLNLSKVGAVDLDNVIVDAGSYFVGGLAQPSTSSSYGIRLPANNNGAYTRLGAVNVVGFYNGYQFAEHSVGQMVAAWGCRRAFEFAAAQNHASKFGRLMAVHCQRGMVFAGPHFVDVDQFDIEHAQTGWWAPAYDLDDPSNYGHGELRWHTVTANVGPDASFLANGATGILYRKMGTPAEVGSGVTVQEEGVTVASGVTQLDFLGATVTAAAGTGEVLVTVTGSGSGGSTTTSGELLMQDGVTAPPVPIETEDRTDWLYQG